MFPKMIQRCLDLSDLERWAVLDEFAEGQEAFEKFLVMFADECKAKDYDGEDISNLFNSRN